MTRSRLRDRRSFIIVSAILLLFAHAASAQTFRGAIRGTVTDSSGAVLPGVTIVVRNISTGLERTTVTTDAGGYVTPELPIGEYSLNASLNASSRRRSNGFAWRCRSRRRSILLLRSAIRTNRSRSRRARRRADPGDTLGGTITAADIASLPLNDATHQTARPRAGAVGDPSAAGDSPGSSASSA